MEVKKSRNNAICITCGKPYELCLACERTKSNWQPWKMFADTKNCYDVYEIINDYKFENITKEKAKELLENCNLTDLNSYKDSIKDIINEILSTKEVKEVEETIEEVSLEEKKTKKFVKKND